MTLDRTNQESRERRRAMLRTAMGPDAPRSSGAATPTKSGGATAAAQCLKDFAVAALRARELGLGVNAGHDLNLDNLPDFIKDVQPDEVSIGHALFADALWLGLEGATQRYIARCAGK